MLQQTQVKTVIPYFQRFVLKFPDLACLAAADVEQVLKAWEGMGYYARARNLHRAARQVCLDHGGQVPDCYPVFRSLPGVGDYIAAAVLSIAFNQPLCVVDGNVKRVLARLLMMDAPVNAASARQRFQVEASHLLDRNNPGCFNQAMMELGALICRPDKPRCGECPVKGRCLSFQNDRTHDYPKRQVRPRVPLRHLVAGVVLKDHDILITRRPMEGLLGGLWEFPGGRIEADEPPADACVRNIAEMVGLNVAVDCHVDRIKHAYTHFRMLMDVFVCRHVDGAVRLAGAEAYRWISLNELENHAFSAGHHKFIPRLQTILQNILETDILRQS
jgi:A/G-specific adenine glycosylase